MTIIKSSKNRPLADILTKLNGMSLTRAEVNTLVQKTNDRCSEPHEVFFKTLYNIDGTKIDGFECSFENPVGKSAQKIRDLKVPDVWAKVNPRGVLGNNTPEAFMPLNNKNGNVGRTIKDQDGNVIFPID